MRTVRAPATALMTLTLLSTAASLAAQNSPTSMTASFPISDRPVRAANMASTYVPLDSWVYPAFDRLSAFGVVESAFASLRPWTRMDCARLLTEMEQLKFDRGFDDETTTFYSELTTEFAPELRRLEGRSNIGTALESVYFRADAIAGKTIDDGYHFAQTETNNFGRPYGEGMNSYTGTSLRATAGPFAAYIRVEVQQAGTQAVVSPAAQAAIALADFTLAAPLSPASNLTRGRLLDAYVSATFSNFQLSFGKQSLWWGPGKGGPLLWSNNAEPITMLRLDRIRPLKLPSFLGLLGPIRGQFFVGRLDGQQFVHANNQTLGQPGISYADQPFVHGEKISFKPTQNFEFGVSRTVIWGGPGSPVTLNSFGRSLFSWSTSAGSTDPGDRRSAFDFSYRVPHLRDWLTVYADTFTDDQPFPLAYPKDSAWSAGIYVPKLPKLEKLDFRAEGYFAPSRFYFPGFYYFNVHYLSGYTNNRQLIGSWIGREGNGLQLWTTWWFSPRTSLQASYRQMSANPQFLRGGNLHDLTLKSEMRLGREWSVLLQGQFERWRFPLLFSNSSANLTASAQLTWTPEWRSH